MNNLRHSIKLPSIKYGCVDKKDKKTEMHLWAANERNNIIDILKNGAEINAEKWLKLKNHVLDSINEAIKGEKLNFWQDLHTNLSEIIPLKDLISQDKEIASVMRIAAQRLNDNIEWSYLLPGLTNTICLFLSSTKKKISLSNNKNVDSKFTHSIVRSKGSKGPSTKIMPDDTNIWFIDPIIGDVFDPRTLDTNISIKAKKIKMKDILISLGTVGTEIMISESAFDKPFEQLINAMNIDMKRFGYSEISDIDSKLKSVDEFYDIEEDLLEVIEKEPFNEKKGADLLQLPKTGQEAVVYMIKCFHLKEMRLAYFNLKSQRILDYYSLVAVKKFRVEKEHYIFSSVGVIHRQTDGTGVAMRLTDWYKEYILYNALKCIPFVKSFLIRKHFQSWFTFMVRSRHQRRAIYLENKLLVANTVFGKSLLQVLKLLDEVSKISMVPKQFQYVHTEVTFLKEFSLINMSADAYLEKFYRYVKLVVDETAAECYKHLQFCQSQAHNIYLYSDDCIYKKKLKQQERQEALKRSMNQVYQLGNFVRLVNYLLNTTIVNMTLHNIAELMSLMKVDPTEKQSSEIEAVFHTNMIIINVNDNETVLGFNPDVTEIEALFKGTITGIPDLILKHCYPLNGLLSAEYLSRYKEILFGSGELNKRIPSILSSTAESRAQMMRDVIISKPDLTYIELPSKSDDVIRVATPPLVNPNVLNKSFLKIFGQAIPSKFTPMSTSNIFDILSENPLYLGLLNGFKDFFAKTEEQMELLCRDNEWLLDVRAEYNEWSQIDMETEWEGQSPYIYEQRLGRVKHFLLQLNAVDKSVTIPSRIFVVSLEQILMDLISEMEFELDFIFNYVLGRVRSIGTGFINDITNVLEILRLRSTDAETFTKVAMHIVECRERSGQYQVSVDYIKSLFDVLKVTDKCLSVSDKDIEDQVTSLWESFLFQLQEANEFVNGDKANVIFSIKTQIQALEASAKSIADSLNDDLYSIITGDCLTVLTDITSKSEEVRRIKRETDSLIVCLESLQSEPYIRTIDMGDTIDRVTFLKCQWNLLNEVMQQIATWKETLFSSFDVPAASDLILEWQRLIATLRSREEHKPLIVNEIDDKVGEFASFMSLFSKLSSPLIKVEHWKRFFGDSGRQFIDPFETLTVGDLIDMDIRQYSSIIDLLFSNAVLRNRDSAEFEQHVRFWMTREFDLIRHVPDAWFKRGDLCMSRHNTSIKCAPRSDAEIYYENKRLSEKKERLARLPITSNRDREILLVGKLEKLNEDITDSLIALSTKNKSPIVLHIALEELRRLCDVLEQCQEKWIFLERIFEEQYFVQSYKQCAQRFQEVNQDFLSALSTVHLIPTAIQHTKTGKIFLTVKSINTKQVQLVHTLTDLLDQMADIISSLDTVLDNARMMYPRLYFLNDAVVTKALAREISHNMDTITPLIRLCFPSIADVTMSNCAISITGMSGEQFTLIKTLPTHNVASQWMKEFELALKSSIKSFVGSYLVQQMTKFDNDPSTSDTSHAFVVERPKSTVFDEVDRVEVLATRMSKSKQLAAEEIVHDLLAHYHSWLLQYPLQTVLLTENIIFYKALKRALGSGSDQLSDLRQKLLQKEKNFLKLNKEINTMRKSRVAIQHLILETHHHIEIIDKLIEDQELSIDSFSYKSLIKYDVDLDELAPQKSLTTNIDGEVRIEMLCYRYVYEYEYLDMQDYNLMVAMSVTDRSVINMMISMHNYEVGSMVGDSRPCKETLLEVSRILGRNMHSMSCDSTLQQSLIQRYMKGALLSGSVLHLDNFDTLQSAVLSSLSRDIWLIKEELKKSTNHHTISKKIRPLSAASTFTKTEDNEVVSERSYPYSSRDEVKIHTNELHSLKLTKERTWPYSAFEDAVGEYDARILTQIHLYNSLLDVRHGFGLLSTSSNHLSIQNIPLSMKSQMRTYFLIPIDESILWKRHLILCGSNQSKELETCIDSFLNIIRDLMQEIVNSITRLLPWILSTFSWAEDEGGLKFGKYLYDRMLQKLSPDANIKCILRETITNSFSLWDMTKEFGSEDSSALIHQLKSQLRIQNLKVSKAGINKMIELNKAIRDNKIVLLTGVLCSGKTVAVDVLSAAVNGLYSSAQRIVSGSKKRGAIDILKTISQERNAQSYGNDNDSECEQKRIYLLRVSLSNFTEEEMSSATLGQGAEKGEALTTIIRPLLKSAVTEKFQIWLHVDLLEDQASTLLYHLQEIFKNDCSVKIIGEVTTSPLLPFHPNPDLHGLVHMDPIIDLWKTIFQKTIQQLLTQKLITYYGCKLLVETGEALFQCIFDSVHLQLQCSADDGVRINCVLQSVSVLEMMLRQYSKYNPHVKEDNLKNIDMKYVNLLCFSVVQGARGTLYSVLVGQRLLTHDEFEIQLRNILSEKCEITLDIEEVNVGIFGLMIDLTSLTIKPYETVKGCRLPELWSNADGVANYMMHLMLKNNKSIRLNGGQHRIESLLDTVRFNKRLHLTNNVSVKDLRKCLHEKRDQYWNIVSNEDPLRTRSGDNDIIVLETFNSGTVSSVVQFALEYKYIFDGPYFEKVRTDDAVLIIASYGNDERNWKNYSRFTRNMMEITVVDPSIQECRRIAHKTFAAWLQGIDKHKDSLSKVVAIRLADFIVDIGLSIRQYKIEQIATKAYHGALAYAIKDSMNQITWSHLCRVIRTITAVPLDVLQHTIRYLEATFSLEKSDFAKKHKKSAIYIRIIRHSIFEVSRAFVDRCECHEEINTINTFIHQSIQKNLSQTITEAIDDLILKHFPVPVQKMTDIVMWPGRFIDSKCYANNSDVNYQPIVEAHCWDMLNKAQENICCIDVVKDHLSKNAQLTVVSKNYEFLVDLMKMYKHLSNKNCRPSALFVEHCSSVVNSIDYGVFLSGLLSARYFRPDDILLNDTSLLRSAVQQAGQQDHKVLLHIDCSCLTVTRPFVGILTDLLNQDSLVPLLQYLQLPFIHQCVRELHDDFYIPLDSLKEIRLAKAFLQNVQRNLKILITCQTSTISHNENLLCLSTFFRESHLNYAILSEYNVSVTEESIILMIGHSSAHEAGPLARVHQFLADYFQTLESSFGCAFSTNSSHLKLSSYLFKYLCNLAIKAIARDMAMYTSALQSVDYAWKEVEVMKSLKNSLQESLKKLNEEIEISGSEGESMRDVYANAMIQCKNQENKVAELFGPLNEMKEKSKTNFDDVSPTYLAALETIRNLDPDAVEEIKTYVKPPKQVRDLMATIFDLLGYETKWELIKERMVKINMFEELLYLDKDHISDDKFKKLEKHLLDPEMQTENLENISQAAASLSKWLTAVYRYSSLNKEINPQLGELLTCQDKINRAQTELGKMRVRVDLLRQELEKKIAEHKELLSKRKNVSDNLKNINYKINSGSNLLSDMSHHIVQWRQREDELKQQMKEVATDILVMVTRCVYLNKLPHSLRMTVMKHMDDIKVDFKSQNSMFLCDEDYRRILDRNAWSSVHRCHLSVILDIVSLLYCPGIAYPDLGSVILIHNCDSGSSDIEQLLTNVLQSDDITSRFDDHNPPRPVCVHDCSNTALTTIDRTLDSCIRLGHILVLRNVHLLSELSQGLLDLFSDATTFVSPTFRLILISNDEISINDQFCCGLRGSEKFLHFNFSLGKFDFKSHLKTTLIDLCEMELSQNILSCNIQRYELKKSILDEKKTLTNVAANCFKESSQRVSINSKKLNTVSESLCLLEVDGLHTFLLKLDSRLVAFDESENSVKSKEKGILARLDKYTRITESITMLLNSFNVFVTDKVVMCPGTRVHRLVKPRKSLQNVIEIIREVATRSTHSIVMTPTVYPDISDAFLERLQRTILIEIISAFYVTMESTDVFQCVLEFCVDKMIDDCQDLENWSEAEAGFIRRIMLCSDTGELLDKVDQDLVNLGRISMVRSVPRQTALLSLVIETNIVALGGLTKSLMSDQQLWNEYFEFPFMSCNPMPAFDVAHQPSLLVKACIWRVINSVKMDEVKSSIISDVFGDDIFKIKLRRSHHFESLLSGSTATKPIVVSTLEHVMTGIESPLEVIHRHYEKRKDSLKIRIIDCSTPSEISKLMTHTSDDIGSYINHLLLEPSWVVLSNFHLCHRFYFSCAFFKFILKNHTTSLTKKLHADSRLFITLELGSVIPLPGSFFGLGEIFHCCPEMGYNVAVNAIIGPGTIDLDRRPGQTIALLHSTLFSSTQFKYHSMATITDYRQATQIFSQLNNNSRNFVSVSNLIYRQNNCLEKLRQVFNLTLLDTSQSIDDYSANQISNLILRRHFHSKVRQNIFQILEATEEANKNYGGNNESFCLVDQRMAEIVKANLVEAVKKLIQIVADPVVDDVVVLNSNVVKAYLTALLRRILLLPVWRMSTVSNSSFEGTLSRTDVKLLYDQQCLSNDLIPASWINTVNSNCETISHWITTIRQIEDQWVQITVHPDTETYATLITTIRPYLCPHWP